ncbi:MAG TPA: hypothetical protein VFA41_19805 [Ktedonobacteraceae bacterium]|jgi:hypothetical protein|nr:hypothetical protein [Ktedonobacteraceae bacterium]
MRNIGRKLLFVFFLVVLAVAGTLLATPSASAQSRAAIGDTPRFFNFGANPSVSNATHRSTLVNSIPYWSSLFTYGGLPYPFQMVGTDPTAGSATTYVRTELIPIKVVFSDGTSFNGHSRVAATLSSPIFQNAQYTSGHTQYGDAIQRAEFWKYVSSKSQGYHVLLRQPIVYPTVTLNVPAANGSVGTNPHTGQPEGLIDINWFDPQIQSLITSLHLSPRTLPIFLTSNTFLYQTVTTNCCIIGYHNALFENSSTGQSVIQTYIWATYNDPGMFSVPIEDINALSHETSEWYNDPFVDNVTPNWISPIAPQYGCNNFLEVGDPLVGVVFTVNGYHPQDEAFYSWFAKQVPSIGIHNQYTYLGTFTSPSPVC